jgi:hypothetical protein
MFQIFTLPSSCPVNKTVSELGDEEFLRFTPPFMGHSREENVPAFSFVRFLIFFKVSGFTEN